MNKRRIMPLLALVLLCGCGSSIKVGPLLKEYSAYERDADSLKPGPPASGILAEARAKRDSAEPFVQKGKNAEASVLLQKAVADARAALAEAQAQAAMLQAEDCRAEFRRIRQLYSDAVMVLRETEKIAKLPPHPITEEPAEPGPEAAHGLPAIGVMGAEAPVLGLDQLGKEWDSLSSAASANGISMAGPAARFESEIELARDPELKPGVRSHHAYVAGRALQEAGAIARTRLAERVCTESSAGIAVLADAHDVALRATLEMERDMKDALRSEARDRQSDLYDALRQLEGKYAHIQKTARGTILSLADILFDFDKATLKRDVEFNLVKVATILNQFSEMRIQVEGHTDNVGTPEYNLDLSQRRAQAVHDFLVSQDVSPERMTVEGFGLTRPVAENDSEEGRRKNRRVDLVIQDRP